MKTLRLALPLVALMLAALACSFGSDSGGSKEPTSAPTEAPATEAPSGSSGAGTLIIDNQSGVDICGLFAGPSNSDTWGDNHLSSDEKISAGKTFDLQEVPAGETDARVEDCDGKLIGELYSFDIEDGKDLTWSVSAPSKEGESSLTVYNKTGVDFCVLYIRTAGGSDWGDNQVESGEKILDQNTYELNGIPEGSYDVRAEACEGSDLEAEREGVDLTDDFQWTLTPPD
jgi:hypothetical protein